VITFQGSNLVDSNRFLFTGRLLLLSLKKIVIFIIHSEYICYSTNLYGQCLIKEIVFQSWG